MNQEDFTGALEDLGIRWREAGQSLVLQSCPACGSEHFKVHLRIERERDSEPFMGRCYAGRCQENYSSFKYLLMSGMDYLEVARIHGRDPMAALGGLSPDVDELIGLVSKEERVPEVREYVPEVDISGFFRLGDWLEHPAAVYALRRGARPEHECVMIDPAANAVVFVVRDGGKAVGYQKRFVQPISPKLKTKSSDGFDKTGNLLHFPLDGAKIVVCEGPFTAIAAWHFGYYALCTFGSSVSEEQIKKIVELADRLKQPVGVAFDLDDAGRKGLARIRSGMFWQDMGCFKVVVDAPDLPEGFDLSNAFEKGMKTKEVDEPWAGPALPDLPSWAL